MLKIKKFFKKRYYFLILFIILYFFKSSLIYTNEVYRYNNSIDISKDWTMKIDGTNINKIINLPYSTKENPVENIISIEKKLPNIFVIDPHLRIASSQQEVRVYLDDFLIYQFDSMRAINNGRTGGALWLLVKLPYDYVGKTLKIEFISSYSNLSGNLGIVKLGSKSIILSELFLDSLPSALLSLSLLIFAIIFLCISIYYKKIDNINFNGFYISILFILLSIWILAESQFFVFLFNNYSLFYFLQFISLFSFPVFLYKYIYMEYDLKSKKYIFIIYKIHFYLLLLLLLFQFLGLLPFYLSQWIFILVFLILFSICIYIILSESRREKKLKRLKNILIILFISAILDTSIYEIKSYNFNIKFLSIGTLLIELYILISIFHTISILRKIKDTNNLLNLQLDYQLKYYNSLKEKNSNLKSYKHDMINHLSTINNLINNNNIDYAKKYIFCMLDNFCAKNSIIDTGNPILDCILTEKLELAEKQNIKISKSIALNQSLKIDLLDYCIIFSNILDNAIEACSKVKFNKYIEIKLLSKNNMLICKISNSIDNNIKINKDFKTTKSNSLDHGIGFKNIKNSINKYNGELSINYTDSIFEVSFILFGV